jgi:hypothetical protein
MSAGSVQLSIPSSAGRIQGSAASSCSNPEKKLEAEIEAERLWWSEVSERQVKDLESSFGVEFQKTTEKLRSDIARCQKRLESMIEEERKDRQAAHAECKLEVSQIVSQQAKIVDIFKGEIDTVSADIKRIDEETRNGQRSNRADDSSAELGAKMTSIHAEFEEMKNLNGSFAERIATLSHKHLQPLQEQQQQQMIQMNDFRRELTLLQERIQLVVQSNEEVQLLNGVLMKSSDSLGDSIQNIASASMETERALRQELETTKCALEGSIAARSDEIMGSLDTVAAQLKKKFADEEEKHMLEANIMRARVDAAFGRLDDMQGSLLASASPAATEQVEALRVLLASTRTDLSNAEVEIANCRSAQVGLISESHRYAEELMSSLRIQMAEGLADERKACLVEVEEVRRYCDVLHSSKFQTGEGAALGDETASVASTRATVADATISRDVQDLRAELATLKSSLHVMDSEFQRCAAAATC